MTNRRNFLRAFVAASLVPLGARDSEPRRTPITPTPTKSTGFGLAEVKAEGEAIAYDHQQYALGYTVRGNIIQGKFPQRLHDKIKKAWKDHYDASPPDWPDSI